MKNKEKMFLSSEIFSKEDVAEKKEILKGQRVLLRPIENSDKDILLFQKWFTDPEMGKYFSDSKVEPFRDAEKIKEIVESMLSEGEIFFIVETNGKPIGGCGLGKDTEGNFNLGIYIGEKKEYEGKGYASEASKLVMDYGFKKLGIDNVYSNTHENNEKSKHLLENLGFKEYKKTDERDEDKIIKDGNVFKRLYYKLSKEDWEKRSM